MVRQKKPTHSRRVEQNNIEATRAKQNSQRKRTNLILNILIIVVSLLIIASLYVVFIATDPGTNQNDVQTASSTQKKEDANKGDQSTKKKEDKIAEKDSAAATEEQESSDPNVSKVISKDWKAVGTKQSGNHVNSYEMNSTDWDEKIQAFSEATDISAENMTIWYVGRGADPATQSVGTVSAKSTPDQAYRVYITWRDGEGWQPTKVEVLKSNDKR
ncbi:YrrS family protein [Listeria ilorinensis]|uniref:YrrS family protein n=1 Tax=Listeria ilorinensis TaxID=2867439 RepID=UPI001EF4BC41|nr:YrrS family protein [Listeria ilorinensis]